MGAAKKLYTMRNEGEHVPADLRRAFEPWKLPPRQGTLFDTAGGPMGKRQGSARIEGGVIGTAGRLSLPPPEPWHRDTPPWVEPARPRPDAPRASAAPVRRPDYEPAVAPELLPWI